MTDTLLPPQDGVLSIPHVIDGETALLALRHSEAYFRALVENARDVIHVINEDRTTRYITPSVRALLGWEPEELVGECVLDIIHPDDVEAALEQIRLARETPGSGRPINLRARHRDGSWRVFEAIGRNLLDDPRVRGIIVNSRDVTGRVQAEEENLRLAAFARENPNPIFECSADGRVLWTNAAGEKLVAELGADDPASLLPPEHPRLVKEASRSGRRGFGSGPSTTSGIAATARRTGPSIGRRDGRRWAMATIASASAPTPTSSRNGHGWVRAAMARARRAATSFAPRNVEAPRSSASNVVGSAIASAKAMA